jgi:hypothetical protein
LFTIQSYLDMLICRLQDLAVRCDVRIGLSNHAAARDAGSMVMHECARQAEQLAHAGVGYPIIDLFAFTAGLHQTTPSQAAKVSGDAALWRVERGHQLANTALADRCIEQQAQETYAGWVTKCAKEAGVEFRTADIEWIDQGGGATRGLEYGSTLIMWHRALLLICRMFGIIGRDIPHRFGSHVGYVWYITHENRSIPL